MALGALRLKLSSYLQYDHRVLTLQIRRLPTSEGLPLPAYQTAGSAGMDLHAAVTEDVVIEPGRIVLVPTGLEVAIPDGFEGQVRPRSGLAVKHGISLPNTPATIDSDYRGEIRVPVINLGREAFGCRAACGSRSSSSRRWRASPGMKCASCRARRARGGGFGHSGV